MRLILLLAFLPVCAAFLNFLFGDLIDNAVDGIFGGGGGGDSRAEQAKKCKTTSMDFYDGSFLYYLTNSGNNYDSSEVRYFYVVSVLPIGVTKERKYNYWASFDLVESRNQLRDPRYTDYSQNPGRGARVFKCPDTDTIGLAHDCLFHNNGLAWDPLYLNMFRSLYTMYYVSDPPTSFINIEFKFRRTDANFKTVDDKIISYILMAYMPSIKPSHKIPMGHFQTEVPNYDSLFGLVPVIPDNVYVKFQPCAPGTWLTCRSTDYCEYDPMFTVFGEWNPSVDNGVVRVTGYTPFGKCYPCTTGVGMTHYNTISVPDCSPSGGACKITIPYGTDPQKLYCKGGTSPPMLCPGNMMSNTDRSGCVCASGYYADASGNCIACPIAHYCINSQKIPCEVDYYQNEVGKSQCKPCLDKNKYPYKSCPAGKVPAKCMSMSIAGGPVIRTYQEDITCIDCSFCINKILEKYGSFGADYVYCYI